MERLKYDTDLTIGPRRRSIHGSPRRLHDEELGREQPPVNSTIENVSEIIWTRFKHLRPQLSLHTRPLARNFDLLRLPDRSQSLALFFH